MSSVVADIVGDFEAANADRHPPSFCDDGTIVIAHPIRCKIFLARTLASSIHFLSATAGAVSPGALRLVRRQGRQRLGRPSKHPAVRGVHAMPSYTTGDIRNVLIVGHGSSGKTTLVDAMLFASGAVNRKGSVADGSSFSDFEKEEKDHGHSIYASALHADHLGKRINFIDTPGSPDLIGHAIACLPAVETVACVINAQNGIEV